ncbi:MAG TPA: hypothetical protein VGH55_07480 [Chthoniobacterales bacterium]
MRFAILLVAVGLSSCASTKLPNTQTAAEQFSVLGSREKAVARNFYDLGSGDAIRRLFWAQRASQQYNSTSDAQPTTNLERRYVVLPVPEHIEPDGTIKEASNQVVEVVQ